MKINLFSEICANGKLQPFGAASLPFCRPIPEVQNMQLRGKEVQKLWLNTKRNSQMRKGVEVKRYEFK